MGGILQALANYNPTGFALANQQRQATLGETIARTAQERAATQGTQAQTEATTLENQIKQRTLRDQDAQIAAWRDLDTSLSPADQEKQLIAGTIKNGGSVNAVIGLQTHYADVRIKNATATKDELDNKQRQRDEDAGILNSIINGPKEEKQFQWAQAIPQIQRHLDPGETLPPEYPGDDAAKAGMNHLLYLSAQSKIAKEQAETGKAKAEQAKAETETPKIKTEADIAELRFKAMQDAAQALGATRYQFIDQQIDPTRSEDHARLNQSGRAAYDAMLRAGASPEDAVKAVEPFAKTAAEIDKEQNPQVLAARRKNEILTRVGTAQAMAQSAGPAFSNITDAAARARAMSEYEKSSMEYADKVGAARQLQDFVKAAQSGNKAAPGLIPIAEVRQLVNRVNRQELQSVSTSAGSAWDRIQGMIGSLKEGQPIPPEILRDISTISGVMEKAVERTYRNKVAVTNNTYRSNAEPIALPEAPPAPAPTAGPPPPMPAILSAADVGKTYTSKTGKHLKIKAVNPARPSQFKADEVE